MKFFKLRWRLSGIAGILFVTISFIASGINTMPPAYDQDNSSIALWFAENWKTYSFGHFLAGISFLLFYFPFYAGLCERLRDAEGKPAIWTRVTWAGAIMSPAVGTIAGAFIMGVALMKGHATPDIAKFAVAANFYAYIVSGAFGGLAMIGAGIIIVRTNVFNNWLGWIGIIIGATAISSTAALVENNPQGLFTIINGLTWLIYFLWIVALSIELLFRPLLASPMTKALSSE